MGGMTAKKPKPSSSAIDWPDALRALRTAYGLHQDEAADKADVPVGTWRNWEQGRRQPGKFAAAFLAAAFPGFDFRAKKKKR